MDTMNLQDSNNTHQEPEIISEKSPETISVSVFDKFFIEVSSLTMFTFRFFKEVLKPPYEFNELMKQSYLIGTKSLSLVGITGFIIGLVLTRSYLKNRRDASPCLMLP
jgi:ABC-type transporter Mla maintaining outer membrane lipid asymmetry permease subunit MlaE